MKNYITPSGYARLQAELLDLLNQQRPEIVRIVAWAASNGDRSENGDYLYGKKRLREIDRRIHFLTERLKNSEVVDARVHQGKNKIFFGARVDYQNRQQERKTVVIVGTDEINLAENRISWRSPIAQAILGSELGDTVNIPTPAGVEPIQILVIDYSSL